KALAERSGLSVSYLSEIEKGKKYPKPERLVELAAALEVPFDELVSLHVDEELTTLKAAFNSPLWRSFPFSLFGLESANLLALVAGDPQRGSALLRAVGEVGRSYDIHVEHFLLSALRAYQHLHGNFFDELEEAAVGFRESQGWLSGERIDAERLAAVLRRTWGYRLDDRKLASSPDLQGLRSVYVPGSPPTLFVNPRLMESQRAFVFAREIGYCSLELETRALSSPWLEVESFDQVSSNFESSYFAGALLMDRHRLTGDLERLFAAERWSAETLLEMMNAYGVTPETFLHRLTQIVPHVFGLGELFFLRFSANQGEEGFRLTKWLNTSEVAVPRGFGLSEHFCRRWPALQMLIKRQAELSEPAQRVVGAYRVHFLDDDVECFEISMARRMALQQETLSAVAVGFKVDAALRRTIRFWDDPAVRRVEVNLTCERCRLVDCEERVASASILERDIAQDRKARALSRLVSS
ncbi:MAG: helix-turn-helix domain-containing protein, partial [Acidobacteriota bacterium]|nr:helix-turn-helix domain-containing protein [Acidobacteriota bacterium]